MAFITDEIHTRVVHEPFIRRHTSHLLKDLPILWNFTIASYTADWSIFIFLNEDGGCENMFDLPHFFYLNFQFNIISFLGLGKALMPAALDTAICWQLRHGTLRMICSRDHDATARLCAKDAVARVSAMTAGKVRRKCGLHSTWLILLSIRRVTVFYV